MALGISRRGLTLSTGGLTQDLDGQKFRRIVSFSLRSGNVRETCNGQGKVALLQCRSGEKISIFIVTEVFDLFCLHLKFILL